MSGTFKGEAVTPYSSLDLSSSAIQSHGSVIIEAPVFVFCDCVGHHQAKSQVAVISTSLGPREFSLAITSTHRDASDSHP